MINNVVLLFSATNEEIPYEHLLQPATVLNRKPARNSASCHWEEIILTGPKHNERQLQGKGRDTS